MFDVATSDEAKQFRASCATNVPASFIDFHLQYGAVKMDIESLGSGLVWLWPLRNVLQFSDEYGFDEFAPGLLGIGSDGCGELYAIDIRNNSSGAVGDIPVTSLQWTCFRQLAETFAGFSETLLNGTPILESES